MAIYYGNEYMVSEREGSHWMELDIHEFYEYSKENPDYKVTIELSDNEKDYIFTIWDNDVK